MPLQHEREYITFPQWQNQEVKNCSIPKIQLIEEEKENLLLLEAMATAKRGPFVLFRSIKNLSIPH